jgi:diketogulonate reductase-like aldo/keto reductase
MTTSEAFRHTRIPLAEGSGAMPVVGFGTLIPDLRDTREATRTALKVGFRHVDRAERYRNEEAVGAAFHEALTAGTVVREDLFVTTKLWNTNHRPERGKAAFDGSRHAGDQRCHHHERQIQLRRADQSPRIHSQSPVR